MVASKLGGADPCDTDWDVSLDWRSSWTPLALLPCAAVCWGRGTAVLPSPPSPPPVAACTNAIGAAYLVLEEPLPDLDAWWCDPIPPRGASPANTP